MKTLNEIQKGDVICITTTFNEVDINTEIRTVTGVSKSYIKCNGMWFSHKNGILCNASAAVCGYKTFIDLSK